MSRKWLEFGKGNLPVVPIRIGTERYDALVDTGALISFIEPKTALDLRLTQERNYSIFPIGGSDFTCPTVTLPPVGFAEFELLPCVAAISSLSSLRLNIDLILGVNAFANLRLQFDFIEGRVYIVS